jgi:hypothetical protein
MRDWKLKDQKREKAIKLSFLIYQTENWLSFIKQVGAIIFL